MSQSGVHAVWLSVLNVVLCLGIVWACLWRLNRVDLAAVRAVRGADAALMHAVHVLRLQYSAMVGAALLSALSPWMGSVPGIGCVAMSAAVLLYMGLGVSRWMRALTPDPASDWSGLDSLIHPRAHPPEH